MSCRARAVTRHGFGIRLLGVYVGLHCIARRVITEASITGVRRYGIDSPHFLSRPIICQLPLPDWVFFLTSLHKHLSGACASIGSRFMMGRCIAGALMVDDNEVWVSRPVVVSRRLGLWG